MTSLSSFADGVVPAVVTGRVGGDAALPCHLRHATQESWAVSVSWFKRGLSGPVYTVDMGSGNFLQAKHRPAHLWAGRAYFSSADEPALLMVGDVAATDAGLYVCSALFANGAQRNSTVRFVVVGEYLALAAFDGRRKRVNLVRAAQSIPSHDADFQNWWRPGPFIEELFTRGSGSTQITCVRCVMLSAGLRQPADTE
ncbi:hypothetical protein HPB48_017744 [Haemaphysalis longicornis]|uniref:Ig-like domain-containing protein n=1 Tax=Haemaphysalis longicornis TaxID=44386 RepID=A0A9J6G3S8_HAELO|nr:hypothetical protein HPB48_017744 [Haemaphysalis longicornis]